MAFLLLLIIAETSFFEEEEVVHMGFEIPVQIQFKSGDLKLFSYS